MPGKRYQYRIIDGPFQGEDCRFVRSSDTIPGYAVVQLRGQGLDRNHLEVTLPMTWLQKKPPEVHKRSVP